MSTYKVRIWETDVEVSVYQRSKSVWVASCTYLGKSYEAQGRTATQAVGAVREKARYATN